MKEQIPVATVRFLVALMILILFVPCGTSSTGSTLIDEKIGQLFHCDILAIFEGNATLAVNGISADKAITVFNKDKVKV